MHANTQPHRLEGIASAAQIEVSASAASFPQGQTENAQGTAENTSKTPENTSFPPEMASRGPGGEPEPTHPPVANQTLRLVSGENKNLEENRSYASHAPFGTCEPPRPVCKLEIESGRGGQWVQAGKV